MDFEAIGTPKPDFAYYGEHPTWLVTLAQTRDSDAAERSNFRYITSGMLLKYPDDVVIESMGHWAVGWVEYLLVDPGSPAVKVMSEWADVLAVYPIADEEDYDKLQYDEEWCTRCDRGTRDQHVSGDIKNCDFEG
jgi:hypothetical protein